MNGSLYMCLCDPTKKCRLRLRVPHTKNRKDFEKHMYKVHKEELEEFRHLIRTECNKVKLTIFYDEALLWDFMLIVDGQKPVECLCMKYH